jgi:hypothetical protein
MFVHEAQPHKVLDVLLVAADDPAGFFFVRFTHFQQGWGHVDFPLTQEVVLVCLLFEVQVVALSLGVLRISEELADVVFRLGCQLVTQLVNQVSGVVFVLLRVPLLVVG